MDFSEALLKCEDLIVESFRLFFYSSSNPLLRIYHKGILLTIASGVPSVALFIMVKMGTIFLNAQQYFVTIQNMFLKNDMRKFSGLSFRLRWNTGLHINTESALNC